MEGKLQGGTELKRPLPPAISDERLAEGHRRRCLTEIGAGFGDLRVLDDDVLLRQKSGFETTRYVRDGNQMESRPGQLRMLRMASILLAHDGLRQLRAALD